MEAIRILGLNKKAKYYQASTSELFGEVQETPQNEETPFHPRSPTQLLNYTHIGLPLTIREAYGIYAYNGILFNHEPPIRGETFVTRKITRALARIKLGLQNNLFLGNMDAKRDWGHAKDYVEMQWLMLQQDEPEDFAISTGVQYTVRDFVNIAAEELGIKLKWNGTGIDEMAIDVTTGKTIVQIDSRYFRPTEVETLLGDSTKAREKLGWVPKISFKELVKEMVLHDFNEAKKDNLCNQEGFATYNYQE